MSENVCGAPSMGPFQGGATMITRGGRASSGGAHLCALEAGHSGPHARRTLLPVSANAALETTYLWEDEHVLKAFVNIIEIKTEIRKS